jgi:hypothetical protein
MIGQTSSALPLRPLPLQSPVTCVAESWLQLLNWGLLFCSMFPPQLIQAWRGTTFLSCSKGLPIWNPQFGGQEGFHVVSTKTPQALYTSNSREHFLHLGWDNFLLRTTSPIRWERTPSVTAWEPGPVFGASVFLTSTKHANAHTDCQEPQGEHMNSLPLDTEIPSLSSQEYTRTHTLQPRTA